MDIWAAIALGATVIGALATALSYLESWVQPNSWKDVLQSDQMRGIEGEYYLYYNRCYDSEEELDKSVVKTVKAIVSVKHTYPLLIRWVNFGIFRDGILADKAKKYIKRRRTTVRQLSPKDRDDITDVMREILNVTHNDAFQLFNRKKFLQHDPRIFDIRGRLYFVDDKIFIEKMGHNNFEKSMSVAYQSRSGQYRVFFTLGTYIDIYGRPTSGENIYVRREYIEKARPEQIQNFLEELKELSRIDHDLHQYMLSPIRLPYFEVADKILVNLRRILGIFPSA